MSQDIIRLHNMQFYGRRRQPEEQALGQRFEVDVELRLDTAQQRCRTICTVPSTMPMSIER
jgi:dihydroneopterin aldolase